MTKIAPAIASIDVDETRIDAVKVEHLVSEMLQVYQEVAKAEKTTKSDK